MIKKNLLMTIVVLVLAIAAWSNMFANANTHNVAWASVQTNVAYINQTFDITGAGYYDLYTALDDKPIAITGIQYTATAYAGGNQTQPGELKIASYHYVNGGEYDDGVILPVPSLPSWGSNTQNYYQTFDPVQIAGKKNVIFLNPGGMWGTEHLLITKLLF